MSPKSPNSIVFIDRQKEIKKPWEFKTPPPPFYGEEEEEESKEPFYQEKNNPYRGSFNYLDSDTRRMSL